MKHFLPLILLCLCCNSLFAQQVGATIYGKVTDQDSVPIEQMNIYLVGTNQATTTNKLGTYELTVPANEPIQVVFSFLQALKDTVNLQLATGERYELNTRHNTSIFLKEVDIEEDRYMVEDDVREVASTIKLDMKDVEKIPYPTMDIVAVVLSKGLGVSVTSELSSQYTVRGGNFDENLVYVNGFEVYRPFLIRSGQQEGLSFINSDMVSDLLFSAGGFQAQYGDKMASVLSATYKQPDSLAGSVGISLLGGSAHLEGAIRNKEGQKKFTFLMGVRQKQNAYLLKGLETTGQYSPSFTDVQGFFTYRFNKKNSLEYITNFARNRFVYRPVDRETTFGVVNNVLRLTMFFEGGEDDHYQTYMNGIAFVQEPNNHLKLRWMGSLYKSEEVEAYDIIAEYFIGEVESDLAEDDFGQVRFNLGVGGIQDFARNKLESTVANAEHQGSWKMNQHEVSWGVKYQREVINDKLNEWQRLDSAGYSLLYDPSQVLVSSVLKSEFELASNRYSGYIQDTWRFGARPRVTFNYGARFTYWDVNKEFVVSPRVQFALRPAGNEKLVFNFAGGMYAQPPFYREMRNLTGFVNTSLKSQKSVHAIFGIDYNFKMWGRKFKFITEAYYKYLYDLVPYEFDNVLIRYSGRNNAIGYATGIDLRLNGEFVKGTDSYVSLSVMNTREDIQDDIGFTYFDEDGNIVAAASPNVARIDTFIPGQIPRPTDQRFMMSMFFQDYLPKNENFKVHLNLIFASGLPFGPPDDQRYGDTLRIPPYRRVDIGFSAQLFNKKQRLANIESGKRAKIGGLGKTFESVWLTFEIYNILGINNTISYLWVKDISNTSYAVPNFLTNRRFNLRMVLKF